MAYAWISTVSPCPAGCGNGTCAACGGSRKEDSGAVDTNGKAIMINCSNCSGSGRCPTCGGSGKVSARERVQTDE